MTIFLQNSIFRSIPIISKPNQLLNYFLKEKGVIP